MLTAQAVDMSTPVTDANKAEYVRLRVANILTVSVAPDLRSFRQGFELEVVNLFLLLLLLIIFINFLMLFQWLFNYK